MIGEVCLAKLEKYPAELRSLGRPCAYPAKIAIVHDRKETLLSQMFMDTLTLTSVDFLDLSSS